MARPKQINYLNPLPQHTDFSVRYLPDDDDDTAPWRATCNQSNASAFGPTPLDALAELTKAVLPMIVAIEAEDEGGDAVRV